MGDESKQVPSSPGADFQPAIVAIMRLSQYQQHRRKLMQIYEDRKGVLSTCSRVEKLHSLKEEKEKSFITRLNHHYSEIERENLRLVNKLEHARPSIQRSASEGRERSLTPAPFLKRKLLETEKENMRLSLRMKNMESGLSKTNFMRDYARSLQIKNRLMRYTMNDSGVVLKSEQYFENQ